jgi:hypothetical protein
MFRSSVVREWTSKRELFQIPKPEADSENTTNGSLWIVQILSMDQRPQKFARWRTKIECLIQHHSPARKLLKASLVERT